MGKKLAANKATGALFRYLDEQTFRFDNRKLTDNERFGLVVDGIVGKRLAWDRLTGKEEGYHIEA